jgi:hypothetical protein
MLTVFPGSNEVDFEGGALTLTLSFHIPEVQAYILSEKIGNIV